MAKNADLDETLNEFVNFGIDYLLNYFDNDNTRQEQQEIPEGHIFHQRILEDVTVTITLMRWYFQKLFHYTFVREEFMNDVKFFWETWIGNRKILYVKVIDAFAIVIEAKLYSDMNKAIPMSTEDCKILMRRCMNVLKEAFDFIPEWNNLYFYAPPYPHSIIGSHYNIKDIRSQRVYENFNEEFFRTMKKSVVKFPIEEGIDSDIAGSREHIKYIFVRLPTEMSLCFTTKSLAMPPYEYQEYCLIDGSVVRRIYVYPDTKYKTEYTFFPQDRKCVRFSKSPDVPTPIIENEEHRDPTKVTDWIKLFRHAVLKQEDNMLNVILISPRYNNCLETMLSRRYTTTPGHFYGDSGEMTVFQSNCFTTTAQTKPEGAIEMNWIEAVHLIHAFYFL